MALQISRWALASLVALCVASVCSAQFSLPKLPNLKDLDEDPSGDHSQPANQVSGLSMKDELLLKAVRPMVRGELENRLDRLSTLDAWEAMVDYDGPIATLMAILSPESVDTVRLEYLERADETLSNKGTPKTSAQAAMDEFADNIAWELKRVAAKSEYRLTLVLGKVTAVDDADQQMVNDVLEQLVENESLTDDYNIVSIPGAKAEEVIQQIAGSREQWTAPDGSNINNTSSQRYHPVYSYVIEGTLRQWTDEHGQEFHSELAARLLHPHSQTMLGGREIRQTDTFLFHPTHQWISTDEDEELARNAPPQDELSPAFRAAAPVARQLLINEIAGGNNDQKQAGKAMILTQAGLREMAKNQYTQRLTSMPALTAWRELATPQSRPNKLLSMLSAGGPEEARARYARRAEYAIRFQSTPRVSTEQVIEQFAGNVSDHMLSVYDQTGRRPVLVLGEVTADDPQTERMLYDVYAQLTSDADLKKHCTIIGLSPERADAMLAEITGDRDIWTARDLSNVSEMTQTEYAVQDMYLVRGHFDQRLGDDGRVLASEIRTTLMPAKQLNNSDKVITITESTQHYFHPIHHWIPQSRETQLANSFDEEHDNGPLPEELTDALASKDTVREVTEPKREEKKSKPRFRLPF